MADGMFGDVASGAASGAGKGAAIGSILAPVTGGASSLIGAGIGAAVGGFSAGQKSKEAQSAQNIPLVDPMQRARLAELGQTRKSMMAGTDVNTQQAINQQRNVGAAAQAGLARASGGAAGSTLDALMKSQRITQGGINQSIAQGHQRMPYFDSAQGTLTKRLADRKIQLSRLKRDQLTAEAAQKRTDNNVNTNALIGAFTQSDLGKNLFNGIGNVKFDSDKQMLDEFKLPTASKSSSTPQAPVAPNVTPQWLGGQIGAPPVEPTL